jgi:Ca2+-binding RTX toxin-like protein
MPRLERAALEAAVLAQRLADQGFRSLAVAFTDDLYGRTAEAAFANVWASLGLSLTETVEIRAGQVGYSAPISQMAAAGGDAVVVLGELGAAAQQTFLGNLTDIGAFDTLAITSPWFDAAFEPSTSIGLNLQGVSIPGESARFIFSIFGQLAAMNASLASLSGGNLQIGQRTNADLFIGTNNPDIFFGRAGSDTLRGGGWADHLEGGSGVDRLFGGTGNDQLFGGADNDTIWGDFGRDTLQGDDGDDQLFGGQGGDWFVFATGDGKDRVADFSSGSGDRLMLDHALWGGGLTRAEVVQTFGSVTSAGVVLDFGNGDRVTLVGIMSLEGLEYSLGLI